MFTYLVYHHRQTGWENLYSPYLYICHMQVSILGHVCEKCILPWQNPTSSYTLSSPESTPVQLVGQSHSINRSPMTCFHPRLYIALLEGTLLDFDAGSLLTLKADSETVFENC